MLSDQISESSRCFIAAGQLKVNVSRINHSTICPMANRQYWSSNRLTNHPLSNGTGYKTAPSSCLSCCGRSRGGNWQNGLQRRPIFLTKGTKGHEVWKLGRLPGKATLTESEPSRWPERRIIQWFTVRSVHKQMRFERWKGGTKTIQTITPSWQW